MSKKYIVFKREEFEEWLEGLFSLLETDPPPPDEAEKVMAIEMDYGVFQQGTQRDWAL